MNHTPGPWRYSNAPQPNGCPIIGAGPLMVAMLAHTVNDPTQRETAHANARLIAAAPKLLAAWTMGAELDVPAFLEWVADRMEFVHGENPLYDYMHHLRAIAQAGRAAINKATSE